jgi:uncharacterized phage protein gp47/JayE
MPIVNGDYNQLSAAQIRDALEDELQQEFGEDIDLTQSSVFSTLAETLATVLSENQEQSLQDVYEAAFLDTATGVDLNRVVEIIGIQRRPAVNATGVQRFSAPQKVTQDYVIQGGTQVQTDSETPIIFETTETTTLELISSFEGGDLSAFAGDTGSGTVVSDSNAPDGSNALEMAATADQHIYDTSIALQRGTTLHGSVRPESGAVAALTFGVQPDDATDYYQCVVDEPSDEVRLEVVVDGSVDSTVDTLTSAGLTAGEYHELEWDWQITDNIGVTLYAPDGSELGTLGGADATYTSGGAGFKSLDGTTTKRFDWYTTSAVSANIRALRGGTQGNVGSNSITRLPSPPVGVDTTTNLYPTADPTYSDTDGNGFIIGRDEESDDTLRERARETVTGGGAGTHDALVAALVNEVQGVSSVTVFENKTDADNTGSGGLPPHSFEAVVFGGDDEDVAKTIFDTKAITARDYGGANGTAVSQQVTSDVNDNTRTITWSRPTRVDVDMTLDIVVGDSYIGDDELRNEIARYIGGTLANGTETEGLGVGEDVRIDQLRDIVVGDDTGVIGFDQSVDSNPVETTPSTTTVNGLNVVEIGGTEVAQVDASDASITLNKVEL